MNTKATETGSYISPEFSPCLQKIVAQRLSEQEVLPFHLMDADGFFSMNFI